MANSSQTRIWGSWWLAVVAVVVYKLSSSSLNPLLQLIRSLSSSFMDKLSSCHPHRHLKRLPIAYSPERQKSSHAATQYQRHDKLYYQTLHNNHHHHYHHRHEILIKRESLVYTRARRAVQKNKTKQSMQTRTIQVVFVLSLYYYALRDRLHCYSDSLHTVWINLCPLRYSLYYYLSPDVTPNGWLGSRRQLTTCTTRCSSTTGSYSHPCISRWS